jgi:uncharacterized membrane protein
MSAPLAVERTVGRVLLWGGLLSIALVVSGLVMYAWQGAPHVQDVVRAVHERQSGPGLDVYTTLGEVRRALSRRPADALALTALGLVCLLATPVAGVALAIAGFWRQGDREYTAIAATILVMLLVSFVLAAAG